MTFRPGVSGNPTGTKGKAVRELVLYARDKCKKAIDAAIEVLDASDDPKVRLQAATFLRDTGMGKPSQAEFDLAQVSDEELYAEVKRRAEAARVREASATPVVESVGESPH